MPKFGEGIVFGLLVGFVVCGLISAAVWDARLKDQIAATKKKAIEIGAAYYHPTTGEFTWREVAVAERQKIDY